MNLSTYLVTDFAEEALPPCNTIGILDTLRMQAIDYTQDAATLLAVCQDHLHRISGSTEDVGHLRHGLDRIENVDRKCLTQEQDEAMPRTQRKRIALCQGLEAGVRPVERTRATPEDSQKARPNFALGTAVTTASWMSSTVLIKWLCPRMKFNSSGFSICTSLSWKGMSVIGLPALLVSYRGCGARRMPACLGRLLAPGSSPSDH